MPESITPAELRAAVTSELRQQLTPYALQLDQLMRDVTQIKWTLYGNEQAGELGLVRSMKSIQSKLDTLIDLSEARENQWKGIKTALVVLGTITSIPALQVVLPLIFKAISAVVSATP